MVDVMLTEELPTAARYGWAINIVRCIVYAMFWVFSNIVKNIEVDVFFKTSLKHRIVKSKKCDVFHNVLDFRKATQSWS